MPVERREVGRWRWKDARTGQNSVRLPPQGATDAETIRGVANGGVALVKPGRAGDDLVATCCEQRVRQRGRDGRRRGPTAKLGSGAAITTANCPGLMSPRCGEPPPGEPCAGE